MTGDVHYLVDQLLLEQGEYSPLELLLQGGRLSYPDYEAWRAGELELLDEALFGDRERVQQELMQAEDYLNCRGWVAETVRYEPWYEHRPQAASRPASRSLRFSSNETLDRCFHRHYRKPQDRPQLDLFTDTPAISLVNGITRALTERDSAEARRQLERLSDIAPDHARVGELERLVEAAEGLHTAVGDAAAGMRALQETLIPLAEDLLGKDSRHLVVPLWRRLSSALGDWPYRASQPELHLSYTASRAMDWDTAREAVEREPRWRTDPVLLLRHARSCDRLHRQGAALQSWFRLCWQFPGRCGAIETSGNHELRRRWLAFLELDPELAEQSFPAWLLLENPGLTAILPEPRGEIPCPDGYRTLYRLQAVRGRTFADSAHTIRLRAQLQQQDPALFHHYMDSVRNAS